jgi:hypothetical protein
MPSAMSGGTCASATLEVAVSANSAAMKKKWCMVILPFDVASRNRSSGLWLNLACLQCSPRELSALQWTSDGRYIDFARATSLQR